MAEIGGIESALRKVAAMLSEWPDPAAIVGGIGIVARTRPRLTTDIDVVIAVAPESVDDLLALAERQGFAHDPEETAVLVEGGLARLWTPPSRASGVGLDLMFVDSDFLEAVVTRATPLPMAGVTLPVATVEDLLIMKLEAGRPQDVDDILAIKDTCKSELDLEYVRRHTELLGISDRLELYFGDEES